MQRERRNQVEPRCAERWHLRDDEQFDLAAWFLFTLDTELVTCGQLLLYFDISLAIELFFISSASGCNEVDKLDYLTTYFHLIVRMDYELRLSVSIDEAFTIR